MEITKVFLLNSNGCKVMVETELYHFNFGRKPLELRRKLCISNSRSELSTHNKLEVPFKGEWIKLVGEVWALGATKLSIFMTNSIRT